MNLTRSRLAVFGVVLVAGLLAVLYGSGLFPGGHKPPPPSSCLTDASLPFVAAVGARANSPAPKMPDTATTLLKTAVAGRKVTFIRLDGEPEVVFDETFSPKSANEPARNNEYNTFTKAMQAAFAKDMLATTAEADPLTALTLAARSAPNGGNIVLLDSGLQTVAPLRFQDDDGVLLTAEPKDVVESLRKQDLLPDLNGAHVLLAGLGNVVEPQAALNQRLHKRVIAIWRAIAEAGGAACVEVVDIPESVHTAVDDVPTVTAVPLPKPPPLPPTCGETVLNDRNDVGFVADQAMFLDERAARATIGKIAKLMQDGHQRAELTGTTANVGSLDGQRALSKGRADAVRKVLVDLGIDESRLTTKGLGSKFPGYQQDHGARGELLPGPAATNRKVIVSLSCDN